MRTVFFPALLLCILATASLQADASATAKKQPAIEQIVKQISAARIEATIRKLVSFETRNSLSDTTSATRGIGAARNWIKSELERCSAENGVKYGDLPEFVDFAYAADVTRINAAALASLALGPAAPQEVQMENLFLENNTTFRWNANAEPDVVGYRVVWRDTTAPFWQKSEDFGNVTRATVIGVSKDNVVFGLQAIDRHGNVSVATFPKPFRR